MAEITSIDDLRIRFAKRKTEASKARVDAYAKSTIAHLKRVEQSKAEMDEKNAIINEIKGPIGVALAAAYRTLPPGEAKLLIDAVHVRVRQDNGVE